MTKYIVAVVVALLAVCLGCSITTRHHIEAHITVDIRHIKDQADNVLSFIEGATDELTLETPAQTTSEPETRVLLRFLNPIRVAHAGEALQEDSPRIKQIAQRLRDRFPKIEQAKKKNYIGENQRGYVELRPSEALDQNTEEKNEIQKLIGAENEDRKNLYLEIVRLNQDKNVSLAVIERVYAMKRLERAKPGEIFRLPPRGEDFDRFKSSALGRRLGDDCVPDAWVVIK